MNDGDDDGDNDGNEDGNDEDNAVSGLGSDGPIFDPITTPRSRGGRSCDDNDSVAAAVPYVSTRWNISTI